MPYVLQRQDGKYVAPAGSEKSCTNSKDKAKEYSRYVDAFNDRCQNERVIEK